MKAPQIILLIWLAVEFGFAVAKHGEPKGNYNLWTNLIAGAALVALLIWGGFFRGGGR